MRVLRVFHHWVSRRKVVLFATEQAAIVALSALAAAVFLPAQGALSEALPLVATALGCGLVFPASLYFADLYDTRVAAEDRAASGARLLLALGAAVLGFAALALVWPIPGRALVAAVGAAAGALVLTRAAMPRLVGAPQRVVVLGEGARARELARGIEASGDWTLAGQLPCGAEAEPIDVAVRRLGAGLVVVACEEARGILPLEGLLRCRLSGVPVLDATGFAERALRRLPVGSLKASDLIYGDGFRAGRLDEALKRAIDLSAALLLMVAAAPLMLLAALLVRLDGPGPVFYGQERIGRGGRVFRLTKFRTMRLDAEGDGRPVWARKDDERVTRVGRLLRKTRMDELPQVVSVLKGDMSFVGPRPERPFFVAQIKQQVPYYGLRELVRPGITGWAQIRYPYGASIDDARAKLEYDLYYMKNRSVFLDLAIIFHTVRHVLGARGAR